MPRLMIRHHAPLAGIRQPWVHGPEHHFVQGLFEVGPVHLTVVVAGGAEGRLVAQVGQIRAAEAGGGAGQQGHVDVGAEVQWLGMDAQDPFTTLAIRQRHGHLPVEAPGAQQRGIQDIGPIGRRQHDHLLACIKAVHLDQELIERLLTFIVHIAHARPAPASDGIQFIDEHDGRGRRFGLLEEIAHPARPHPDEHLHKLRGTEAEEGHARFPGDGPPQQRLARPRWPHQQHAARDPRPQRVVLLRMAQEVHLFLKVCLRVIGAGHIGEGHLRLLATIPPRLGPPETKHAALIHGGPPAHPDEKADQQERR
jgi:hypothetical protein